MPIILISKCLIRALMVLSLFVVSLASAAQLDFARVEKGLIEGSFDDKAELIQRWFDAEPVQALAMIDLMLDSRLYYHKDSDQLYRVDQYETGAAAVRIVDNQSQRINKKRDFKRVSINNTLRSVFKRLRAQAGLSATDAEVRRQAAQALLGETDPVLMTAVAQARSAEQDTDLVSLFDLVLAIADLEAGDSQSQGDAIARLSASLYPQALNALNQFVERSDNAQLIAAAKQGITEIEGQIGFYANIETLYFGLSLGSVLVLAGIGLAITFGVMGVINMAHGELIMIGAYTTYVVQQMMPDNIEASLFVAVPAAFVVSGLVGIAIERGVIRFLYGRPLETLLATFGISLVLQQAVRSIFSPLNRSVETPEWMSGMIQINPVLALTQNRLYILVFCLLVFAALLLIMKKTRLGLQVRAVSQNRAMARAMGVRSEWVDAMTFGLGSGVAGIAGVALSQLTNVGPNLGQTYLIDSFMVVVFGGVGNLWGTLVAGLSLGVANKVMEPWAGAVLAKILVLVFIILFIQKRPRGLFPQRGRAAEG